MTVTLSIEVPVSVPIKGIIFLTGDWMGDYSLINKVVVSVPIKGIIFLTRQLYAGDMGVEPIMSFRPHQGDYFFNPVFETAGIY